MEGVWNQLGIQHLGSKIERVWQQSTAKDAALLAGAALGTAGILSAAVICKSIIFAPKPNHSLVRSDRELLHNKFSPSKVPEDIDVIIIGSGMSGLSCAAILARLGRKVLVLEQHEDVCGGGTHMFVEKGFRFDSGLHYTVPWSVPVFALTCLKKPKDVVPFDLMGDETGTVDKIYLVTPEDAMSATNNVQPFDMKYREEHIAELYKQFPQEKAAIDEYMTVSNNSMHFVKAYLFARLLPKWLQRIFWCFVPSSITNSAAITAKELLPKLTSNKRLIALLSSMWIDTGARPDKATFMLTASVFRGISMEGGCYPRGGSTLMAKELVTVIESFGGSVLIRANIEKILIENNRAVGVKLTGGQEIRARQAVVSSAGYVNTTRLISDEVLDKFGIPRSVPNVGQSAGFVMCNIGINLSAAELGVTNTNTWHIPIDADGDCFGPLDRFFNNPLGTDVEIPVFITFPSSKDKTESEEHPNQVTAQMLVMADYAWFEKYLVAPTKSNSSAASSAKPSTRKPKAGRSEDYEDYKNIWREKCLSIFFRYFPKARGHVAVADVSTPLSIENWLSTHRGGGVGLDVTPERFADATVRDILDPVTDIKGLYMTGQDTAICGVTLCQLAGVITAFRMEGFFAATRILFQSILLGD